MSGIYWLASYPKSGNTWFRSFLKNLQVDGDAPVDINELNTGAIASSRGWLDEVLGFDTAELTADEVERLRPDVYRWSLRQKQVGYHKIHDAYTLTDRGEPLVSREATLGALYIVRNPLDVVSSAASHWGCSLDQAITNMGKADMTFASKKTALTTQVRQKMLSWSGHVLSWADTPGLKAEIIRYEDMLSAPIRTFTRAAQFLDMPDEQARVAKAIEFSSFDVLKQQEETKGFRERSNKAQRFFRQGRSGGWRDTLSKEQVTRVIEDHRAVMQRFGYLDESGAPI